MTDYTRTERLERTIGDMVRRVPIKEQVFVAGTSFLLSLELIGDSYLGAYFQQNNNVRPLQLFSVYTCFPLARHFHLFHSFSVSLPVSFHIFYGHAPSLYVRAWRRVRSQMHFINALTIRSSLPPEFIIFPFSPY